jgi:nitrile hydratase accessory protein
MQTNFEHFAVTSMLGQQDAPPRLDGKLRFAQDWERQAFGVALALSRSGHFDWEDFRQQLISAISEWEQSHDLNDSSWDYYERWLTALERVLLEKQLVRPDELAALMPGECHPADPAAGPEMPVAEIQSLATGMPIEAAITHGGTP